MLLCLPLSFVSTVFDEQNIEVGFVCFVFFVRVFVFVFLSFWLTFVFELICYYSQQVGWFGSLRESYSIIVEGFDAQGTASSLSLRECFSPNQASEA